MLRSLALAKPLYRLTPALTLTQASSSVISLARSYSYFADKPSGRVNSQPSTEVPDVSTFLTKIGRNMSEFSDKFETWESLVKATSADLKEKGIDTRGRRYLLSWIEKYSRGEPLQQHRRGQKKWGGERRRKEMRNRFFSKITSELRKAEQSKLQQQLAEDRKRMEAELY